MQSIRWPLFSVAAFLSATLPASAQMNAAPPDPGGLSLGFVWVWILAAGITIFIIGTCSAVKSGKR